EQEHGEPITPDRLTTRLGIAPTLAETLHARLTA
ncbi:SpdA protein, partial [Streptomyces oryzae]|nr:SpdA protein [Streptomyces oryzae]